MNWKNWLVTTILILLIVPIIFILSFETDGHVDCDTGNCKKTCNGDLLTSYDLQYMTEEEINELTNCGGDFVVAI